MHVFLVGLAHHWTRPALHPCLCKHLVILITILIVTLVVVVIIIVVMLNLSCSFSPISSSFSSLEYSHPNVSSRYAPASACPVAACTTAAQPSSAAFAVAVRRPREGTRWPARDDDKID